MFTKLETPILTYLTIGDWSEDGHGSYEKVYFKVNYPVDAIQQAYKDSCRKTGVQFNHNENYTGTEKHRIYDQIWTEYDNDAIRPAEGKILREYGVITDEYLTERGLMEEDSYIINLSPKDAADIIMRFIALSMPKDFCYTEEKIAAQPINGWWNPNLNCQFGYGLYE